MICFHFITTFLDTFTIQGEQAGFLLAWTMDAERWYTLWMETVAMKRGRGAAQHTRLLSLCKRHCLGVLEKGDVLFTRRLIGISDAPLDKTWCLDLTTYCHIYSLTALSMSHWMHLNLRCLEVIF